MPNYLAKSDWKSELKKRENKDVKKTGISDALDALASAAKKNDKGKQVTALETIISKAQTTKKKHAALKPLGRYLDSMVKAAKALEDRLSQEAAAADDSGGNNSDLAKALARLRTVTADSPYHFVAAPGRPSTGLVVSRKQVQQKDIKAAHTLRGSSGLYFTGSCWYEGGNFVFDLGPDQKPPKSLAKAIKGGAKLHAEKVLQKVVVRGGGEEYDDSADVEGSVESGEAKTVTGGVADYPTPERWSKMLANLKAAAPDRRPEIYGGISGLVKRYREQAAQDQALGDSERTAQERLLANVLRNADALLAGEDKEEGAQQGRMIPTRISHGVVNRETTEALLQGREEGSWIMRYANGARAIVISFVHQGKILHQTTGAPQDADQADVSPVLKFIRLEGTKMVRKGEAPLGAPAQGNGGKSFDPKAKWAQVFEDLRSLGMIKDKSTRGLKAMDEMYWGEYLDRKQHTYGRGLEFAFNVWKESGSADNFSDWLEKIESGDTSVPGRDQMPDHYFDDQGNLPGGKVWYMTAKERADFEARANKGSINGPTVANGVNIFVIGPDSKLYVGQKQRGNASQQAFNHSTFFAGKPVKSAGTLRIAGGKVTAYFNLSGHYAPGVPETIRALAKISGGDRQALAGIAMNYDGSPAGSCLDWFESVTKTEEKAPPKPEAKPLEKAQPKKAPAGIPVSMSHGNLGSADVVPLLQNKDEGTWLIRFSTNVNQYVISIVKDGQIAHQTTKQGLDVQNLQGIPYPQNMMLRP